MRKRGRISVNGVSTITTDLVGVYFKFEGKRYVWQTSSWRNGNKIAFSIGGDEYNVSFTILEDGYNVKNLRVLK